MTFIFRNILHFFSDCHIEKSWPVNQSVLEGKEQMQGVIIFKTIGEDETAELGLNSVNLNHGKYYFDQAT